jgi:ATP-dependent Clp protease ATP-binding subunit ClpC
MKFDLKNSEIFNLVKIQKIFKLEYVNFFKNLFLFLFIISVFIFGFSYYNVLALSLTFKLPIIFFIIFIILFEFSLFIKVKKLNPELLVNLKDAILKPDEYNLAEFLNIETVKFVHGAIKFCNSRKIFQTNSTVLLYSAVKYSKEINILCFRLGIDTKKLLIDAKNFQEKSLVEGSSVEAFSEDFKKVILDAGKIAVERNHLRITEKEILIALAKNNEFFQKVLIDYDLKGKDVEDLSLWLDSVEDRIKSQKIFWSSDNLSRAGANGQDWSSGYTITLDQYSVDWRDTVSKWLYKEVIGHKKEIEEIQMVLARSNLSNALIIGDPGTGRKSIIEAIAQKCYLGQSLPELNNKRVVELDMTALLSTIQDSEKLETILDKIFMEVVLAGNVILVVDELQNYVGQKIAKAGAFDISGILAKYLAIPTFQFVGITSYAGLHQNIEQNPSFLEYFRKIEVLEITEIETIKILQNLALELEAKYKILVIYPAIREIVNLAGRYFPSTPFPKKAIDVLDEAVVYVGTLKEKIVMPHHIAKIISDKTQIPVGKMEFKEKEVLLNLENLIHQRIVNQEEAVREISIAMRRARAGIASKKRPMGTFLFLGPTGVGKTETAKALAQIYFSGEDKIIRIDMSEFQAISDIPRLIGAISPIEMQGLLTTPVRETPFSLILLDEIEKAHSNILNLFLQVLDEGHITDGQGRKVMFTNTIIICTSNAGASDIFKSVEAGEKLDKEKILGKLFEKNIFRPEFVNRFDATVTFHPLTKENLLKIAQITLIGLQKNLKEKEIDFIITEPLKTKIVELSYKPEFGAREMRRVVQDKVENSIAEALISDKLAKGNKFEINPETFEIIINPV